MTDSQFSAPAGDLRRVIGFWSAVGIVVGTTIGSGVFRAPQAVAEHVGDPRIILLLWAGFGLVSLCGCLSLAELACLLPHTGGIYVYLRAAFGDSAAFVFGWLYLLVTVPSALGALAVFFAELVGELCGVSNAWVPAIAIATIVGLMAINIRGVAQGLLIQNLLTLIKVGALVLLIGAVFTLGAGDVRHWTAVPDRPPTIAGLAAGIYLVMWSNSGWQSLTMVAGEMADPSRRLTPTLATGILTVVALYVGANLAYLYVLPVQAIEEEPVVAGRVMALVLGETGRRLIQGGIIASVLGALNGVMLARSRVVYALARDGLAFGFLGKCHPRWATPYAAILAQGGVAIVLVLCLGQFTALTRYFAVVEYLALAFAVAAVLVLRRTMPEAPRPYRTFGYPWVPLLFVAGAGAGVLATLWSSINEGAVAPLVGLAITALGFPVFWLWRGESREKM
jgi:amino acid transporter